MRDVHVFIFSGREFHSLVANGINDLSYKLVLDLGTVKFMLLRKFLWLTLYWFDLPKGVVRFTLALTSWQVFSHFPTMPNFGCNIVLYICLVLCDHRKLWHDYYTISLSYYDFLHHCENLLYWKEKETHIHFECYLYQRCIVCVKESVFEMLNIHVWTQYDIFHCKQTTHVSCIDGKSDRGNANKIHAVCNNRKNWFFNCPGFGQFGINWKLLNVYIIMEHENYATCEF